MLASDSGVENNREENETRICNFRSSNRSTELRTVHENASAHRERKRDSLMGSLTEERLMAKQPRKTPTRVTPDQEAAIRIGARVLGKGNWVSIRLSAACLYELTTVQIKDKYRNMEGNDRI